MGVWECGRMGDGETWRRGDAENGRKGEWENSSAECEAAAPVSGQHLHAENGDVVAAGFYSDLLNLPEYPFPFWLGDGLMFTRHASNDGSPKQ